MAYRSKLQRLDIFVLCIVSVLISGLASRALASDVPQRKQDKPDLVVMTFNIRYGTADDGDDSWDKRKDLVYDVLREHRPDVLGLQEALRSQIDEIRAALPQYAEIGVGRDDGKTAGEYSAILYKKARLTVAESGTFWLSDTPAVPGSKSWGNNITRICTWGRFTRKDPGGAFYLFNTHLDHQSQPSRQRSAVLLARRIAERVHPDPVLVTGDFNAGEDNPAVRYLKGEIPLTAGSDESAKTPVSLVDTFRVLHPDAKEVGTFHGFKGNGSGAKIDYIFAPPGTEVLNAEILRDNKEGRYPSDHFPVLAAIHLSGT